MPEGKINEGTVFVFIASILFFIGSTFYVKTMIREKKNIVYKRISWFYHLIVPVVYGILGYWIAALAFLPSLFRAVYFYGKPMSMMKIGIMEIVNAVIFFSIMVIHLIR